VIASDVSKGQECSLDRSRSQRDHGSPLCHLNAEFEDYWEERRRLNFPFVSRAPRSRERAIRAMHEVDEKKWRGYVLRRDKAWKNPKFRPSVPGPQKTHAMSRRDHRLLKRQSNMISHSGILLRRGFHDSKLRIPKPNTALELEQRAAERKSRQVIEAKR